MIWTINVPVQAQFLSLNKPQVKSKERKPKIKLIAAKIPMKPPITAPTFAPPKAAPRPPKMPQKVR